MAKGVKKIKYTGGVIFPKMSVPNQRLTVVPDQWVSFDVAEWLPDTSAAEKKNPIVWLRESSDRKTILSQISSSTGYKFKISKKYSGNYYYYIEASMSGKRDFKNNVGLYVKGYCEPKIVSSKWCTKNDGTDVRKTLTFSYGHLVYLGLNTEGINGDVVTVDVFRRVKGGRGADDDQRIWTYTSVKITDGEINLKMGNTYLWYAKIGKPGSVEEFYVKVKNASGKYISDGKDTIHARYLRIKNDIVSKQVEVSTNNTPVKIGSTNKAIERISLAVVYFRPLDSWNGEFGFDWLREKDNGLASANDPAYDGIIEGGYLDGKTDLTRGATGTAYTKLKTQYPNLAVSNTGYAVPTYFVPYLTLFSKDFVDTLPATVAVKPKYEATLKVLVAINGPIDRLEFEYDTNLLTVDKKILKDKSKTNGLVKSADVTIKVTCKKDLSTDKEIKVYCYPTNGQPKMLAGKIVVLKNDATARKKQKFVLISVKTNILNMPTGVKIGTFSPSEKKSLQEALYQSIITSSLETGPVLDLSSDSKFQILTDLHGNKTYGDYIFKNTQRTSTNTDGNINEDKAGVFDYVKNLFIRKNPQYTGYYTMFCFNENTYDSFYDLSTGSAAAVPGQVQDIKIKNVFLFNGIQGATRGNDTISHEGLHGLGLQHTHADSTPIPEINRKFVFANGNDFPTKSTDNIMSYGQKTKKSTWKWQWDIVRKNV